MHGLSKPAMQQPIYAFVPKYSRMNRRGFIGGLVAISSMAGCVQIGGEERDDDEDDIIIDHDPITNDEDAIVEYNIRVFDRIEHPDTGEVFETDDDTQWIGVVVHVTNQTDMALTVQPSWIEVYADGVHGDAPRHESSYTEPLTGIPPGETVEAFFIHSSRPGMRLEFRETPFSIHQELGIRFNEDLEFPWD